MYKIIEFRYLLYNHREYLRSVYRQPCGVYLPGIGVREACEKLENTYIDYKSIEFRGYMFTRI